jgi:hypothetical protein
VDAVWLALHPVAANSGASVLVSYLDLCRALGRARVPLVGEHTGFLGLSLLGLNAVGGIESGITFGERFDMGNLLRKPRDGERKAFATQPRVYIDKLGTFLDRKDAERFLAERGAKRRFGCQDQPCCRSPEDMIKEPRRHFLYARAREVADLARVPAEARPTVLLDSIREASDGALQAARIDARFAKDQVRLGDWREALAKRVQAREHPAATIALGRGRFRRRKIA